MILFFGCCNSVNFFHCGNFSPFVSFTDNPLLFLLLLQPPSSEEKEGLLGRLAALVVCLPGLVPLAVPQRRLHLLHSAVRLPVRQGEVHQVGHVPGPLPFPEHLHLAASKGDHPALSVTSFFFSETA